nr:hypothetical protein [Pseudonocardia sp. ICBG601]
MSTRQTRPVPAETDPASSASSAPPANAASSRRCRPRVWASRSPRAADSAPITTSVTAPNDTSTGTAMRTRSWRRQASTTSAGMSPNTASPATSAAAPDRATAATNRSESAGVRRHTSPDTTSSPPPR